MTGVNGGAISGRRGGAKPGQLSVRRHVKGPDRAPLHVGGEDFSPGYAGVISPVSGLTLGASAGAGSLRRRVFDCLSR